MEEPDIEIGAGVSSKAISRRVPLERHASNPNPNPNPNPPYPPRYERRPPTFSNYGLPPAPLPGHPHAPGPPMNMGFRQPEQYDPNTMGVPPAVPGFGFQYPPGSWRKVITPVSFRSILTSPSIRSSEVDSSRVELMEACVQCPGLH